MNLTIETLRQLCTDQSLLMTKHAVTRIRERSISLRDIKMAIQNGEVIAQYPDDYPYPSCLVLGYSTPAKPLHVVTGIANASLWIITAYFPDKTKWEEDYKTRKEGL
jgi:hypothetical protein